MRISSNFNRFIFGVVLKELRHPGIVLEFRYVPFKFRTSSITKESMRELFKHLDLDYPRDNKGKPLSYTKLDSKQMSDHIRWIELIAGGSGVVLPHIEEEWARLMENHR